MHILAYKSFDMRAELKHSGIRSGELQTYNKILHGLHQALV